MRFQVLTAGRMSLFVFWVVMPYGLVGRYQCFRGTYCPRDGDEHWYLPKSPHNITTQETNIKILKVHKKLILHIKKILLVNSTNELNQLTGHTLIP
jgi:hypothetical protein